MKRKAPQSARNLRRLLGAQPLLLALVFACNSTERVHELVLVPGPAQSTTGEQPTGGFGPSSGAAGTSGNAGTPNAAGASGTSNSTGGNGEGGVAGEPGSGGVSGMGGTLINSDGGSAGESSGGVEAGGSASSGSSGTAGIPSEAGSAGAAPISCTDLDCGGSCPPCAEGKKCQGDADCSSGACDAGTHTCVADQCSDHRQDGLETDADCGGPLCSPCRLGERCLDSPDCLSVACDGMTLRCIADQCHDHRQDGNESDVDCGGFDCDACGSGQKCRNNFDCMAAHVCFSMPKVCH